MKNFILMPLLILVVLTAVSWKLPHSGPVSQENFYMMLADSAALLADDRVVYDPSYFSIPYPGGDVPAGKGVCTDVVIRAYRKLGTDLQELVHRDMKENFEKYPSNWGLRRPDPNIDHRRVPNLMTFFSRHGTSLEVSGNASGYMPGDIVCWDLGSGVLHIGIVVNRLSANGRRHLIIHNIGSGQNIEDVLFTYRIIGHYKYGG